MCETNPDWDNFSRVYVSIIEKITLPMAQILFDSLNIDQATNVLEGKVVQSLIQQVGTGNGQNLQYFIQQKPEACHWCATDASQAMLSICQQRIEEFLKNPIKPIQHDYMTEKIPQLKEKTIPEINVSFKQADANNLKQFESNTFDRYYANLVIGTQIDQQKELMTEAMRVLKPEGLIGISVAYGRQENSPFQTLYKDTAIEYGLDKNKFINDDIFESSKKDHLLPQLEAIGFQIQKAFYVCFPVNNAAQKVEALLAQGSLQRQQLKSYGADDALVDQIQQKVKQKSIEYQAKTKSPITMEVLFIVGKKNK